MDETEDIRKFLVGVINTSLDENELNRIHQLVDSYGWNNVWDTAGVQRDFEVLGFLAPFCVVRRKSDNVKGTLAFCHSPRFYFDFRTS